MNPGVEHRNLILRDLHVPYPTELARSFPFAADRLDEVTIVIEQPEGRSPEHKVSEVPVPHGPCPLLLDDAGAFGAPQSDDFLQAQLTVIADLEFGEVYDSLGCQLREVRVPNGSENANAPELEQQDSGSAGASRMNHDP